MKSKEVGGGTGAHNERRGGKCLWQEFTMYVLVEVSRKHCTVFFNKRDKLD